MNSDLYLGLTTLEAGVFAIFAAALFVMIQSATDIFSPITPHILIRRWSAILSASISFVLLVAGLMASVKATFPNSDYLPGDQRTDVFVFGQWAPLVFALAIAFSVSFNLLVLIRLISDFRGPGLVSALVKDARDGNIEQWMDAREPPPLEPLNETMLTLQKLANPEFDENKARREIQGRNRKLATRSSKALKKFASGSLTDPLSSLFEIAARSTEARRYPLVDRSLDGIVIVVDDWLRHKKGLDVERLMILLRSHFGNLLEIAIHTGSYSQISSTIHTCERIALHAIERKQLDVIPVQIADELFLYSKRMGGDEFRPLVTDVTNSVAELTNAVLREGDYEIFKQCLLRLARVAEVLGRRYRPETGVDILEQNLGTRREEKPEDALYERTSRLISGMTMQRTIIPGNVVLVYDALAIEALAFLETSAYDRRTASLATNFIGLITDLGLVSARTLDGDALYTSITNVAQLQQHHNFAILDEPGMSTATSLFHIGILTEMNAAQLQFEGLAGVGDDLRARITRVLAQCSDAAIQSAVDNVFRRGHTGEVPDVVQRAFKQRLETAKGRRFPSIRD